jgi:tetratricopeptide (TPR) repeat protein
MSRSPNLRPRWIQLSLLACTAAVSGCASVETNKVSPDIVAKKPAVDKAVEKPAPASVSAMRDERRKTVVAEFERERDRAQYQAALSHWHRGDAAAARETLAPVLVRNPDYRDAHLLAAQLDLFADKPKSALAHARQILVAHPDDAQAHFEAAVALDAMGAAADALPHYEKAAQLAPKDEVFQASYQAAVGIAVPPPMGSAVAASISESAGRANPAANSTASYQAESVGHSPLALDRQLGALTAAARANPDNPQLALDAAILALRQNRPEAAVEIATTAVNGHADSAPLWRTLAMAQYGTGDFAGAEASLKQAIALDKSNALAYFLMGSILSREAQSEAARQYFDEATRLDPRFGQGPN